MGGSSSLTCFCNNSSVLLVGKKQLRRQRHKTHSASQTLLARAARTRQRLGGRVSALGLNGGLDSVTHHPEPEEVEESWALESGDSHGRLPFRASGRRDVDLGQNHSTETQPSPPHTQPRDISLRMQLWAFHCLKYWECVNRRTDQEHLIPDKGTAIHLRRGLHNLGSVAEA